MNMRVGNTLFEKRESYLGTYELSPTKMLIDCGLA